MILIAPFTAMNESPPIIVFSRLLSTDLKTLPMIVDTVGNNKAVHIILAPDVGVDESLNRNEEELFTFLWK